MKLKKRTKILVNLFCSLGVINQGFAETYTVKRGDILSQVLYDKNLKPIYGKDGTLLKVVELNSELKNSKGNIIHPGMVLNLDVYNTDQLKYNLTDNRKPRGSLRRS